MQNVWVQADPSIGTDIWVVDPGGELDCRRLEGIISWQADIQVEYASSIWRVLLNAVIKFRHAIACRMMQ